MMNSCSTLRVSIEEIGSWKLDATFHFHIIVLVFYSVLDT